jgi:hypothetical protein
MNKGTILRTILAVAVSINTALAVTDVTSFENESLNLAYKIASMVVNFIVVAINTYYNNDYTEEACVGTGVTRMLKDQKKIKDGEIIGEDFISEVDSDEHKGI